MRPEVHPFMHEPTSTWTYVVGDPGTRFAVVIDPVLDFDIHSGRCWTAAADEIVAFVRKAASGSSGSWKRMPMPIT